MSKTAIDNLAKEIVTTKYGLPPSLHIPIAARNENALTKYIGSITQELGASNLKKAFLIQPQTVPQINKKLPIWKLSEAAIFHTKNQVWVHVNYSSYRKAYARAFPNMTLKNLVMDHGAVAK